MFGDEVGGCDAKIKVCQSFIWKIGKLSAGYDDGSIFGVSCAAPSDLDNWFSDGEMVVFVRMVGSSGDIDVSFVDGTNVDWCSFIFGVPECKTAIFMTSQDICPGRMPRKM